MNYQETLDFLFSQLPVYQRIGKAAYKADLNNTIALCDLLDNPQHKFKSIHIAGTNGKGSVSHMLASVLYETGLKVGLYTSPHLRDFRERIRINGKQIPEEKVIDFVEKHKNSFYTIKPSFFEMTVALAFEYFAEEKVDIAVIEVGLGGRLDSTNIINPELSVITNISIDHTAFLGETLKEIASEKAGIIKKTTPVVIGETQTEIKDVFIRKAREVNAPISFAESEFTVEETTDSNQSLKRSFNIYRNNTLSIANLELDLLGSYQKKNIITVMKAIDCLNELNYNISIEHIRKAVSDIKTNTGLLGRWQILGNNPMTICDTGHNISGITEVISQLKTLDYQKLHMVFGMVNDKDPENILSLLPKDAEYYFCQANIPRAMDVNLLFEEAVKQKLKGRIFNSVEEAFSVAKSEASGNDVVFVGGSTFVVAQII